MTTVKLMLDTNIFNRVLDGKINSNELTEAGQLFATHVQIRELKNTPDQERRDALVKVFQKLPLHDSPTLWILGETPLGSGILSDEKSGKLISRIQIELDSLKKRDNNHLDSMISEVAIREKMVLVTDDNYLRQVVLKLGGAALSTVELKIIRRS
ncbi:MAG TPA: hypothetical protein VF412_06320 [Bdellovibrio sp.]|uniref:hypothetical protein n=1 Tax=Bdellovibrio sp. TaxID=28201 RepID=UPI002F037394